MASLDRNHFLVLIGGIIMVVQALVELFLPNPWALIALVFGLLAIASTKVIDIKINIPFTGPILVIIGVVGLIFRGWIGAIIIIIVALLILMKK